MRKIEQEMVNALREGKNWKKQNTEVVIYKNQYGQGMDRKEVFLNGNLIFVSCGCDGYDTYSNCGFNTAITLSRLNALAIEFSGNAPFSMINGVIVCDSNERKESFVRSERVNDNYFIIRDWTIGRL